MARRQLSLRDLQAFITEWMRCNYPNLEPEQVVIRSRGCPIAFSAPIFPAALVHEPRRANRHAPAPAVIAPGCTRNDDLPAGEQSPALWPARARSEAAARKGKYDTLSHLRSKGEAGLLDGPAGHQRRRAAGSACKATTCPFWRTRHADYHTPPPANDLAAQLIDGGWEAGVPEHVTDQTADIDRRVCRFKCCLRRRGRGMAYRPFSQDSRLGRRYRVVAQCACGHTEEL